MYARSLIASKRKTNFKASSNKSYISINFMYNSTRKLLLIVYFKLNSEYPQRHLYYIKSFEILIDFIQSILIGFATFRARIQFLETFKFKCMYFCIYILDRIWKLVIVTQLQVSKALSFTLLVSRHSTQYILIISSKKCFYGKTYEI